MHAWPRRSRLLKRSDFQSVYNNGSRHSNPLFTAFLLRSGVLVTRVGFTAPRALGNAVDRNRIKRRMREAVRLHYRELGTGWDVVFNPRRAARDASFSRLEKEVSRLFTTAAGDPRQTGPGGGPAGTDARKSSKGRES